MTRSVWEKVITDANGVAQPTASIEVRDASTNNLAAIYDALSGGSAKTNPFTVDAAGYAKFYVDPGIYNIKATVGADVKQLDNVEIGMNRRDLNLTDVESASAARTAIGASEIDTIKTYAISQFAGGDSSKVGVLENGVLVDALDYVVYPVDFTVWRTNGATGTSDGTLNTGTGAAGGVTGTLIKHGVTPVTYNQEVTIDFPADEDFALNADKNLYGRITLTDIGFPLTAPRVVTVSDTERDIVVRNNTGFDVTVKTLLGSGVVVPSGRVLSVYIDGTDAVNSSVVVSNESTGVVLPRYISPEQVITSGGLVALSHGLKDRNGGAVKPFHVSGHLTCLVAEHGYSVGDEACVSLINNSTDSLTKVNSVSFDETSINLRFVNVSGAFVVANKQTGAAAYITDSNWRVILKAWY